MPLTDVAVRKTKPTEKPQRLFDGGGLYLEISPQGGRCWRLKYRYLGKEKRLALGTYPEVSLADARERRDQARKLLASGIDPGEHKKTAKAAKRDRATNSFELVAREWFAKQEPLWKQSHSSKIITRLEQDIFPWIGSRPIAEVTAPLLLESINRIAERGAVETAHRVLQTCGAVFRYAVRTGRCASNPAPDLRGALPPVKKKHHAALLDTKAIGELLRVMDAYSGSFVTRCALQLAPLVFVRPGELRQACWSEFDLDAGLWSIPADRMKKEIAHLVPLSSQAIAILAALQPLTGRGHYVFPGARSADRPMSENTVNAALRRMGFDKDQMTGHGFRAVARTILDETLHFRPDYIEHQLAHAVRDPNGRAYNRTAHLDERRKMMQGWADFLEVLKANHCQVRP